VTTYIESAPGIKEGGEKEFCSVLQCVCFTVCVRVAVCLPLTTCIESASGIQERGGSFAVRCSVHVVVCVCVAVCLPNDYLHESAPGIAELNFVRIQLYIHSLWSI